VLSATGSVHAQQPQPALPEERSPFSQIAHDFNTWLHRATGAGASANHHRPASSPPLMPRPRPAELMPTTVTSDKHPAQAAPAPVVSEQQSSEAAPTSVSPTSVSPTSAAPNKKTPAPVLIND
jgi:hypothetical protein